MKKLFLFITALMLGSVSSLGKSSKEEQKNVKRQNQHKEFNLKVGRVYTLYIKKGTGTTTVMFPFPISNLSAVNVIAVAEQKSYGSNSDQENASEAFALQIQPDSSFFTLSALKKDQTATLTVMGNNKAFILYLKHDPKKAYSVVNFTEENSKGCGQSLDAVTPARLLSLLNIAKTYDILGKQHPELLNDTKRSQKQSIFQFDKFSVSLLDSIRFNKEDTLVFKLLLKNKTKQEIRYNRHSFNAMLGNNIYYMSASDCSGIIPPNGQSFAFFAITGSSNGFRNNLSPDNSFIIGLTANYMLNQTPAEAKPAPTPNQSPKATSLSCPAPSEKEEKQ